MSYYRRITIPTFKGINTLVPAHMIDDGEAQVLRDAYIHLGRLEARKFKNLHGPPSGLLSTWKYPIRFFAKLHDGETRKDVIVTNGHIYRDYSSVASGFDQRDTWTGFIYNGDLYLASEHAMRVVGSSTLYNWGIDKPATAVTVAAGAAGNLNGDYYYKVTFYNADGIESEASDASTKLTLADQKASLTAIPTSSDAQTTGRYIYRIGGLVGKYTRIKDLDDNTTTTYTDNMTDADASDETQMSVSTHDDPANIPIVVLHLSRAFYAGHPDYPNRLYYSDSLYPEYTGSYRTIGGYEKIITLCVWEGELFIWKKGEIWSLRGSVPGAGFIQQLSVKRGTVAPNSVAVGKFPTYIHDDGIYTHDGYVDYPVGRKLYTVFKNDLNTEALKRSVAVATRQFYYVSVPEKGKEHPNILIVYNYETRDSSILELGATSLFVDEGGIVHAGTEDGRIYKLDGKFNSEPETINLQYKSKKFFLGPTLGRIGSVKNATIISNTSGEDVEVISHVDGTRIHCGTINSSKLTIHNVPLGDRDGEFFELELKYSGQKRPIIYPPILINPDVENE